MTIKNNNSIERFSYSWQKFNTILPEHETQFLKWIYPLKQKDFRGKIVLDAGCGIGRNSYWALKYGARELVAFDYDKNIIRIAQKNLSEFPIARIRYSSIYDINYVNKFDIVFCIGVIHHLEEPALALKSLYRATKKTGKLIIWVYADEGNEFIVKYINPIRSITCQLPLKITYYLSYIFSVIIYIYVRLFSQQRPYYKQISKFSFRHIHNIIFDQLIPKIAYYWKKTEIVNILKKAQILSYKIWKTNGNSWTIIITK